MESIFSPGSPVPHVRENLSAPGPGDDDQASPRLETRSTFDAHRRCRPPCKMVFRAEGQLARSKANRNPDGPSNERASHSALEIVAASRAALTPNPARSSVLLGRD